MYELRMSLYNNANLVRLRLTLRNKLAQKSKPDAVMALA